MNMSNGTKTAAIDGEVNGEIMKEIKYFRFRELYGDNENRAETSRKKWKYVI